ncbi:hypothetical protein FDECE_16524 [Fusarium decemcellulare]|nr:hypothetical protein FDECE_16524 [Fusarium decemcellulare]
MLHIRQTESGLRRYDSWVERSELRANSSVLPGGAVGLEDTFDNLYTEGSVTELKSQFVQFVIWAFGPDGVSSLDSIVYGDFGNDNDYSTNLVIVRDRTGDKPFKCLKQGSEQREAIKRSYRDAKLQSSNSITSRQVDLYRHIQRLAVVLPVECTACYELVLKVSKRRLALLLTEKSPILGDEQLTARLDAVSDLFEAEEDVCIAYLAANEGRYV